MDENLTTGGSNILGNCCVEHLRGQYLFHDFSRVILPDTGGKNACVSQLISGAPRTERIRKRPGNGEKSARISAYVQQHNAQNRHTETYILPYRELLSEQNKIDKQYCRH